MVQSKDKDKPPLRLRSGMQEIEDPFQTAIGVIGGKHKIAIVWLLSTHGRMRFSELKRILGDSSQRMLSISLRELEEDSIIRRRVVSESPPWVEYELTSVGTSLVPVLEELTAWGAAYQDMVRSKGLARREGP